MGAVLSSLSPGLRWMLAGLGSQEAFGQARMDLAKLAGIPLTGKRVRRSSEADGERVRLEVASSAQTACRQPRRVGIKIGISYRPCSPSSDL
ncbi:MAG TPA: hypothetical protein VNF75_00105 [Candidatus Dormibacteraeota bacterium]|nr:hypothetical protein [Candidatus Dormibacteraeota bacterium]